jgi:hypothetical protein
MGCRRYGIKPEKFGGKCGESGVSRIRAKSELVCPAEYCARARLPVGPTRMTLHSFTVAVRLCRFGCNVLIRKLFRALYSFTARFSTFSLFNFRWGGGGGGGWCGLGTYLTF